jgi:cbb3-type cytochrome oxidase subunit 3
MMKDVVRSLESGILPEIGLIAFVVAFVLIVIYALTMKKQRREDAKQIPLQDDEIVTPPSDDADPDRKPDTDHAE